jgi:hypothetical protein
MYDRLITLGCSITHHVGWARYLSESMKIPLINLAQSSSSNGLQQRRFQELMFNTPITTNDIVIWQITGSERSYLRKPMTPFFIKQQKNENKNALASTVIKSINIFDKKERIDFLSHSYFSQKETGGDLMDVEQHLEDLLFYIISAKKMTPNTFVVYGWDTVITTDQKIIFEEHLSKHNVNIFNNPIVDWCRKNKLPFFKDGNHPRLEAYMRYCNNYMYPQLKEFLDIH